MKNNIDINKDDKIQFLIFPIREFILLCMYRLIFSV